MPPALSVPLAAVFVWVFSLVIGTPGFLPFAAAFLAGYLGYDMLHYHVHHHRPKSALGKRLRELRRRSYREKVSCVLLYQAEHWSWSFPRW
jgi:dihydroceramide fatty acyl 2-hydroxylase